MNSRFSTIGRKPTRRGMLAISMALAGLSWATQREASGQTLTWDASGAATSSATATDGSGNWNTLTNSNWFTGTAPDSVWVNGDSAVFGNNNGAAGTVTINDASGSVSVGTITFNPASSGGYTIAAAAGDSLNLSAANSNPLITVSSGVSATIAAPIGGSFNSYSSGSSQSGLIINGLGTLTLTGNSNYSGSTIIENDGTSGTGTTVDLNGGTIGNTGSNFYVGLSSSGGETDESTLTLNNNATLNASDLVVSFNFGESTESTTLGSSVIVAGNATMNVNEIQIDAGRNSSNTKGGEGSIVLDSGATLTLNGTGGAGSAVSLLDIANYSYETGGGTGTAISGEVNFAPGTVNGTIGTVNVGTGKAGTPGSDAADGSTATFTFGNGSLNIGTLNIARLGSEAIVGTVTMAANTTGTLTVGSLNFGATGNGASNAASIGVLNISGGTLDMTGTMSIGG
ncbi:MAG TPA: hypothetical protein VL992_05200, partial [Tepidisphaeraceae bacterium]|nr:hypothetical protein [Tepidisphaeraceae bacterium]